MRELFKKYERQTPFHYICIALETKNISTYIHTHIYNASKHADVVLPAARRVFPAKRREQRELFLLLAASRRSRTRWGFPNDNKSRGKEETKKFALVVVWIEREFDKADASNRGVRERADENEVSAFKRGRAYVFDLVQRAPFSSLFLLSFLRFR